MVRKLIKKKERKILFSGLFTAGELTYLDRKINKTIPEKKSRNALLRTLVGISMEKNLL